MKTRVERIAERATEIAAEGKYKFSFCVNGNVIEGCRSLKTSETYKFDVENNEMLYDRTRFGDVEGIIREAVGYVDVEIKDAADAVDFSDEMSEDDKEAFEADEVALSEGLQAVISSLQNNWLVNSPTSNYKVTTRRGFGIIKCSLNLISNAMLAEVYKACEEHTNENCILTWCVQSNPIGLEVVIFDSTEALSPKA